MIGSTFAGFAVQRVLGAGAMGEVLEAVDTELRRVVALKVLPKHLLSEPKARARFELEMRTVAGLEHRNIVRLYAGGVEEGVPWMALQLIRGGDLAQAMRNGPLEWDAALKALGDIAAGLDFAHAKGVVHRDLKPQNVLVGDNGECFVADFGIAFVKSENARLTGEGDALGTPRYMAPEQALGRPVDARADVYALGTMAYEMLTGRVPFHEGDAHAVMHKHVAAEVPIEPLKRFGSAVEQVLLKALAKQPNDRWSSAGEFVAALRGAVSTGDERGKGGPLQGVVRVGVAALCVAVAIYGYFATTATTALVVQPEEVEDKPVVVVPNGPTPTAEIDKPEPQGGGNVDPPITPVITTPVAALGDGPAPADNERTVDAGAGEKLEPSDECPEVRLDREVKVTWPTVRYPPQAIRKRAQGRVDMRLKIEPSGAIGDVIVTRSSGEVHLDRAAVESFRSKATATAALNCRGEPIESTADVFVDFKLSDT